ncbi:MAG: hypothetical protein WKF73_02300 [Nocardioidaceae bacterium]
MTAFENDADAARYRGYLEAKQDTVLSKDPRRRPHLPLHHGPQRIRGRAHAVTQVRAAARDA